MVTFYNYFVKCGSQATISDVAEHIYYIRNLIGVDHIASVATSTVSTKRREDWRMFQSIRNCSPNFFEVGNGTCST